MGKHYKYEYKKEIVLSLFKILFIIALIVFSTLTIKWYINSKQNKELKEKISKEIIVENIEDNENTDKIYNVDFEALKKLNTDTVAWLKVNGTEIEYPVVQAKDNNCYLNRNLEKVYNAGGWIFADYKNKLDGTDKNIVIYGHNMKDNSMFGTLKNILKEEWYNNEKNYLVDFIRESEKQKYQVFSVYQIKTEDYYIDTEFKNNEFENFIEILKNRSIKDFNVEVSSEDRILTLSTCANNYKDRIVLHAKKI